MQMQGSEAVWKLVLDAHLHCVYPGPGFGCFLDESASEWQAFCEPATEGTARAQRQRTELHVLGDDDVVLGQAQRNLSKTVVTGRKYFYEEVISKLAFCEGSSESSCFSAWQLRAREYVDASRLSLNAKARLVTESVEPVTLVAVMLFSSFVALCTCACMLVHRRRLHAHLRKLEAELEARREASERARGGEDTAALVLESL
jgi:hypothetical protein